MTTESATLGSLNLQEALVTGTRQPNAPAYVLIAEHEHYQAQKEQLATALTQAGLGSQVVELAEGSFAGLSWVLVQLNPQESATQAADLPQLHQAFQAVVANSKFDWFDMQTVKPNLNQPGLWVTDMDKTLVDLECLDQVAHLAGSGDKVAEITKRAMRGELDFKSSLEERVATLAGKPASILEEVASSKKPLPLDPGAVALTALLKEHEWETAIASGGFTYFAELARKQSGIQLAACNEFEIEDGKFTGKLVGDIVGREEKAMFLKISAIQQGLPPSQTIATGDGANDLSMIAEAGWGVAYKPSYDPAKMVGRVILHTNLAAIGCALIAKQELQKLDYTNPTE